MAPFETIQRIGRRVDRIEDSVTSTHVNGTVNTNGRRRSYVAADRIMPAFHSSGRIDLGLQVTTGLA